MLQLVAGNCGAAFMAFPVNAAVMVVMVGGLFVVNREWRNSVFVRVLASREMSVAVIVTVVAACLVLGLVPQREAGEAGARLVSKLGLDGVTSSVVFYAVMLLLMGHLTIVTMRYERRGGMVWRFRLNHIGLLVALFGLCFGAADTQRLRALVPIGGTVERAYDEGGVSRPLGYGFMLTGFDVEYYENGTPAEFSAYGVVDGERVCIRVNHPWRASWRDDVYLTGYDVAAGKASEYCVLEFVRQPWKYVVVAGIAMMAAGAVLLFWGGRSKGGMV